MSLNALFRGWFGEARGALAQWLFLDRRVYTCINNVTVMTATGTTQIDHVIVSRHGLFVVEAKNWSGLIFGNETDRQWTQVLGRKKYRQQNPLHQNYRHMKALEELLRIEEHKIILVVMLWGNCQVKGLLPPNVITRGYTDFIKRHTLVLFSDAEVARMVATIRQWMLPRTAATRRMHVAGVTARFGSETVCPRCGGALKLRTARTGTRAGMPFYGCVRFPGCRYTRDVGEGGG